MKSKLTYSEQNVTYKCYDVSTKRANGATVPKVCSIVTAQTSPVVTVYVKGLKRDIYTTADLFNEEKDKLYAKQVLKCVGFNPASYKSKNLVAKELTKKTLLAYATNVEKVNKKKTCLNFSKCKMVAMDTGNCQSVAKTICSSVVNAQKTHTEDDESTCKKFTYCSSVSFSNSKNQNNIVFGKSCFEVQTSNCAKIVVAKNLKNRVCSTKVTICTKVENCLNFAKGFHGGLDTFRSNTESACIKVVPENIIIEQEETPTKGHIAFQSDLSSGPDSDVCLNVNYCNMVNRSGGKVNRRCINVGAYVCTKVYVKKNLDSNGRRKINDEKKNETICEQVLPNSRKFRFIDREDCYSVSKEHINDNCEEFNYEFDEDAWQERYFGDIEISEASAEDLCNNVVDCSEVNSNGICTGVSKTTMYKYAEGLDNNGDNLCLEVITEHDIGSEDYSIDSTKIDYLAIDNTTENDPIIDTDAFNFTCTNVILDKNVCVEVEYGNNCHAVTTHALINKTTNIPINPPTYVAPYDNRLYGNLGKINKGRLIDTCRLVTHSVNSDGDFNSLSCTLTKYVKVDECKAVATCEKFDTVPLSTVSRFLFKKDHEDIYRQTEFNLSTDADGIPYTSKYNISVLPTTPTYGNYNALSNFVFTKLIMTFRRPNDLYHIHDADIKNNISSIFNLKLELSNYTNSIVKVCDLQHFDYDKIDPKFTKFKLAASKVKRDEFNEVSSFNNSLSLFMYVDQETMDQKLYEIESNYNKQHTNDIKTINEILSVANIDFSYEDSKKIFEFYRDHVIDIEIGALSVLKERYELDRDNIIDTILKNAAFDLSGSFIEKTPTLSSINYVNVRTSSDADLPIDYRRISIDQSHSTTNAVLSNKLTVSIQPTENHLSVSSQTIKELQAAYYKKFILNDFLVRGSGNGDFAPVASDPNYSRPYYQIAFTQRGCEINYGFLLCFILDNLETYNKYYDDNSLPEEYKNPYYAFTLVASALKNKDDKFWNPALSAQYSYRLINAEKMSLSTNLTKFETDILKYFVNSPILDENDVIVDNQLEVKEALAGLPTNNIEISELTTPTDLIQINVPNSRIVDLSAYLEKREYSGDEVTITKYYRNAFKENLFYTYYRKYIEKNESFSFSSIIKIDPNACIDSLRNIIIHNEDYVFPSAYTTEDFSIEGLSFVKIIEKHLIDYCAINIDNDPTTELKYKDEQEEILAYDNVSIDVNNDGEYDIAIEIEQTKPGEKAKGYITRNFSEKEFVVTGKANININFTNEDNESVEMLVNVPKAKVVTVNEETGLLSITRNNTITIEKESESENSTTTINGPATISRFSEVTLLEGGSSLIEYKQISIDIDKDEDGTPDIIIDADNGSIKKDSTYPDKLTVNGIAQINLKFIKDDEEIELFVNIPTATTVTVNEETGLLELAKNNTITIVDEKVSSETTVNGPATISRFGEVTLLEGGSSSVDYVDKQVSIDIDKDEDGTPDIIIDADNGSIKKDSMYPNKFIVTGEANVTLNYTNESDEEVTLTVNVPKAVIVTIDETTGQSEILRNNTITIVNESENSTTTVNGPATISRFGEVNVLNGGSISIEYEYEQASIDIDKDEIPDITIEAGNNGSIKKNLIQSNKLIVTGEANINLSFTNEDDEAVELLIDIPNATTVTVNEETGLLELAKDNTIAIINEEANSIITVNGPATISHFGEVTVLEGGSSSVETINQEDQEDEEIEDEEDIETFDKNIQIASSTSVDDMAYDRVHVTTTLGTENNIFTYNSSKRTYEPIRFVVDWYFNFSNFLLKLFKIARYSYSELGNSDAFKALVNSRDSEDLKAAIENSIQKCIKYICKSSKHYYYKNAAGQFINLTRDNVTKEIIQTLAANIRNDPANAAVIQEFVTHLTLNEHYYYVAVAPVYNINEDDEENLQTCSLHYPVTDSFYPNITIYSYQWFVQNVFKFVKEDIDTFVVTEGNNSSIILANKNNEEPNSTSEIISELINNRKALNINVVMTGNVNLLNTHLTLSETFPRNIVDPITPIDPYSDDIKSSTIFPFNMEETMVGDEEQPGEFEGEQRPEGFLGANSDVTNIELDMLLDINDCYQ